MSSVTWPLLVIGSSKRYSSLTKLPGGIVAALGLLLVFKWSWVSTVTDGELRVQSRLGAKVRRMEFDELFMQ